jgi:hypothetical protein
MPQRGKNEGKEMRGGNLYGKDRERERERHKKFI